MIQSSPLIVDNEVGNEIDNEATNEATNDVNNTVDHTVDKFKSSAISTMADDCFDTLSIVTKN